MTAPSVLNVRDLEWKAWEKGPPLYHTRFVRLGQMLGARKLGYHLEEFPPGTTLCPYHGHLVNEELFLVLAGEMSVRLDGAEYELGQGDLVGIPPGPNSAHQLLNRGAAPARLLALSTTIPREVVDYPDSRKRLYEIDQLVGEKGPARAMVRDGAVVDYFEGEPGDALPARSADGPVGGPVDERGRGDRRILRRGELEWERLSGGAGFGGARKRLSRAAGARRLGYSLYRLLDGEQPWPFHFHHVNEELFFVLAGRGELRTSGGMTSLEAGDAFACSPGPEGAHALRGVGAEPFVYLAVSTMEEPEVSEYPDSGKLYVLVGSPPGGDPEVRAVDLLFRRRDAVDYLQGEAAAGGHHRPPASDA